MNEIGTYAPSTNSLAFDSSAFLAHDNQGMNVTHGADPANTAPDVPKDQGSAAWLSTILDVIIDPTGEKKKTNPTVSKDAAKTLIWSVLLVVIGLMLLSRGFGLIGEEGAGLVVDISNPTKYPGIGHAIRGLKGKK